MDKLRHVFQKKQKSPGGSTIEEYAPVDKTPEFGFSKAPPEWQEYREAHYQKWLGDSEETMVWHEILPIVPHIDVHIFPPSEPLGRDFYTLITSGMSDEKMTLPKGIDRQLARAELVFYIADVSSKPGQTEKPWFVQAISFFAHFPFDYKTWLAPSHTIPNGNPPAPVVEGSMLTTAIFLPAIFEPKEFVQDFKLSGERVNFLWLSYISDKETEFKLNEGYNKLTQKMNKDNFPQVFDPFRPSII
jgi:hypothetical protein